MSLLFRLAVYIPVLFLVAIVVVGQQHATARDTIHAAARRTLRWLCWTLILLIIMLSLDVFVIGW